MSLKKIVTPIFLCAIIFTGCFENNNFKIKKINMETSIEKEPYINLKSQWKDMTLDKYVLRTAQQVWKTWPYAEKIWPGADFSKFNLLITETKGRYSWLISYNKKIVKFNSKDLPKSYKVQGIKNLFTDSNHKLNNIPTIKVEIDSEMFQKNYDKAEFESLKTGTLLFPFTTHEEFHRYQNAWKPGETDQEKLFKLGENNFKARTQRLEIINALNNAIINQDKEKEYLQAAKWWFEEYKKDNPQEYKLVKTFDILEGSARYFDMAMNIRSIFGMDLKKEDAFNLYKEMIIKDYKLSSDRYYGLPDEESYDIGGLSGVLLEAKENSNWKSEVEKGKTPLEILLKDYKKVPQKNSDEVLKLIDEIKKNRK